MKIDFEDESFIQLELGTPGKIILLLGAKDKENPLKKVINSCDITYQELSNLIASIGIQLPPPQK